MPCLAFFRRPLQPIAGRGREPAAVLRYALAATRMTATTRAAASCCRRVGPSPAAPSSLTPSVGRRRPSATGRRALGGRKGCRGASRRRQAFCRPFSIASAQKGQIAPSSRSRGRTLLPWRPRRIARCRLPFVGRREAGT